MELENIKGLGPSKLKLLNKMGIYTQKDLLQFYPFRYDVLTRTDLNEERVIIDGTVESIPYVVHFNKKMDKMNFKLNTGSNLVNVVIFNRGFLKQKLVLGTTITVIGKYDNKKNNLVVSDIRFGALPTVPKIEPVYHATYGISSKQISSYMDYALAANFNLDDYIPDYLNEKYKFISKNECVRIVHQPSSMDKLKMALNKLKYEELFLFMMKMNYLKQNKTNRIGLKRDVDYSKVNEFINDLPFKLTDDQEFSVKAIYDDLVSDKRMNRLVQGDVGSGKTIVSFIAIYINYLSGYQSALMAPTEILAVQHYNNLNKLLGNKLNIALLTGKLKAKEKKEIYKRLENGEIDIVIGTHALFSDSVNYYNLGLVVTDEQHRFGVNQRANLKNKGLMPDILYMSATPIPRTFALTLYGDMDISSIHTMPSGRKKVLTYLKKEKDIKDVLEAMYEQLKQHHQIYVIAPLIEESDKIDLENVNKLAEKMDKAFGKVCKIGVLHGKLSNNEKDEIMNKFKNNEIQILISTTVIEVGVDVLNATMMVIFDAYRFGLSALHQLRGRVGRNELQSYCYLVSNRDSERLDILTRTSDGFKISEEDFNLRGSGDLFGVRQSGDMVFSIADFKRDYRILLKAKEDSIELLNSDEYKNNKYYKLKELIENSTNLD